MAKKPDPLPALATPADVYAIAEKYVGVKEVPGKDRNHPLIMEMLQLDQAWPESDEVPWCSAFANFVCHEAGVARSGKLNAKSWLGVGRSVTVDEAQRGDVCIFTRGTNPAHGHVAFFDRVEDDRVYVLGGNQGDAVCVASYPLERLLQINRVA